MGDSSLGESEIRKMYKGGILTSIAYCFVRSVLCLEYPIILHKVHVSCNIISAPKNIN
jgi:hypothetical protein